MSNSNGLFASTDVCATGDSSSNFFVRKGEAIIVPSPLLIVSPNGAEVGTIAEDNSGDMSLLTSGGVEILADNGLFLKAQSIIPKGATLTLQNNAVSTTSYVLYDPTSSGGGLTTGQLALFGYAPNAKLIWEATPAGDSFLVGDSSIIGGSVLNVNGPSGVSRVFDTLYNPPAPITTYDLVTTFSTDMVLGIENASIFTLPASGLYQIVVNINVASATLPAAAITTAWTSALVFADPAHAALVVTGSEFTLSSFSISQEAGPSFAGYHSTSMIVTLSDSQFVPNQPYRFVKFTAGGVYSGGAVTMSVYRLK